MDTMWEECWFQLYFILFQLYARILFFLWEEEAEDQEGQLLSCCISRFSTKPIVFWKMFQMSLTAKKVDYIFEEL